MALKRKRLTSPQQETDIFRPELQLAFERVDSSAPSAHIEPFVDNFHGKTVFISQYPCAHQEIATAINAKPYKLIGLETFRAADRIVALVDPSLLVQVLKDLSCTEHKIRVYVAWNTEQMTRVNLPEQFVDSFNKLRLALKAGDSAEIWDYSAWNATELKRYVDPEVNIRVVPTTTAPEVEKLKELLKSTPKLFDFAFVGFLTQRREKALEALKKTGKTLLIVNGNRRRDCKIASARALINIHAFDDYKVFESVRCARWLAAGLPVLTEESVNDDEASRLGAVAIPKFWT